MMIKRFLNRNEIVIVCIILFIGCVGGNYCTYLILKDKTPKQTNTVIIHDTVTVATPFIQIPVKVLQERPADLGLKVGSRFYADYGGVCRWIVVDMKHDGVYASNENWRSSDLTFWTFEQLRLQQCFKIIK